MNRLNASQANVFWIVLLATTIATLFVGCVRYVPSRSELSSSSKEGLGGEKEFFAYESALSERLQTLVSDRSKGGFGDDDAYRLGAGDTFQFGVFGFPDLSQDEVEISSRGTVSLPLVGDSIELVGLTPSQAREKLAGLYRRFIRSPQVILTVKQYQASTVAVTGAVARPGLVPLKRQGMQLNEVLALAGGRTDKAGNRVLLVPAAHAGKSTGSVEVAYEDLLGSVNSQPIFIPVMAGDTIVVPEAGKYEVDGEVQKPGSFTIAGRTTVFGAIAAAGGFTYAAKVDEVEVIRDVGNGQKAVVALNLEEVALQGKQDIRLRDGDVVRVPTTSGRHFQRQIVEGINSVFRGVGVTAR